MSASTPSVSPEVGRGHHLPALLLLLALHALAMWPLPLGKAVLGHPTSDLVDHLWGAWWWGGELLAGRLPLQTTLTHLPTGSPLWYVDPLGALLVLFFRPAGFPTAFNLALYCTVAATSFVLYALGWRLLRQRGPALLVAVAGGLSPYVLGLLHSGLSEYLGLLFPALFVAALWGAMEGRTRFWWAALALAGCTLQAFYYGAFAVLLACCALLGPGWRQRLRVVLPAVALGLVLCLPILWAAGSTVFGAEGAVGRDTAPGWQQVMLPATDVSLFLRPGKHYFPDTPALGNPGILHVHYLGWGVLLLTLVGFWRHPRLRPYRWGLVLFLVAGLGPAAAWGGRIIPFGRGPLPLPLALLYRIPPWDLVHHPYRLAAFSSLLLAFGAGAGLAFVIQRVSASGRRWAPVALGGAALALVLAETLLVSPAVWPLPTTPWAVPSIYARLAPDGGAVLDWPPDGTLWNRRYLSWQIQHQRPIPYGLNIFLPEAVLEDPLVVDLLHALNDPVGRARNRDVPRPLYVPALVPGQASGLRAMGVGTLVLHEDALAADELQRTLAVLQARFGAPQVQEQGCLAWRL